MQSVLLHSFCRKTREHHEFNLSHRTALQIAFLDIEYWANIADSHSNANRIARYLELLRSDLLAELSMPKHILSVNFQPETTKQWAVRINHNFGHSFYGRQGYFHMCKKNKWSPYAHEDPALYGGL